MKNLKKVLALGLSAAMALSMFVTGAGAAFTDQADIKATEAVNMLSSLGVIKGNPDGSFKPEGTVTRAEMAKMIFVVRNGGKDDASSYENIATSFGDIKGHWAAGYIKFCETNKIIAGKSATLFDPEAPVTGTEAAKMLLVVMGYTPDKAGLVGPQWDKNTLALAGENGLLDDVDSSLAAGLPRQYAAQVIYNTLDANRVSWSNDSETFDYVTTIVGGNAVKESVGEKYMGYKTVTGILVSANNGDGKGFSVKVQDSDGKYDFTTNLAGDWNDSKYTEDLSALLGEEVKVTYDADKYKDNKDCVFGVFATDNNTVVTATANKVKLADAAGKVKVDGTEYKYDSNSQYFKNTAIADFDLETKPATKISDVEKEPKRANTMKFVDVDGDNKLDIAIEFPMAVAEVSSVSSSAMTVKSVVGSTLSEKSPKLEDVIVYDGVAKKDLVMITYDLFQNKVSYEKADVVKGTINGVRSNEFKLESDWVKEAAGLSSINPKSGEVANAVIINGLVYYYDKVSSGTGNEIAAVVSTGTSYSGGAEGGDVQAKLMFMDGTTKVVKIEKTVDGAGVTNDLAGSSATDKLKSLNNYLEGTSDNNASSYNKTKAGVVMVTYSKDSSDNYTLEKVSTSNDAGYDSVLLNQSSTDLTYIKNIGGTELKDDAIVLAVYGTSDVKKMTGKEVKRMNKSALALSVNLNGVTEKSSGFTYVTVATMAFTSKPVSTGADNYGYITNAGYSSKEDGKTYAYATVWTTDGSKDIKWEDTSSNVNLTYSKGKVIAYDVVDATGEVVVVDNVEVAAAVKGAITGWDGNKKIEMLKADGTKVSAYEVNSDTDILYVDTDDNKGREDGSLDTATEVVENQVYIANALFIGSSDQMDLIVYDINDNLYGDKLTFTVGGLSVAQIQEALNSSDVTSLAVKAADITSSVTVPAGKKLVVTDAATAAMIQKVTPEVGAKLVLDVAASSIDPSNVYTSVGTESAGGAVAAGSTSYVAGATFTGVKVYTGSSGSVTTTTGWMLDT